MILSDTVQECIKYMGKKQRVTYFFEVNYYLLYFSPHLPLNGLAGMQTNTLLYRQREKVSNAYTDPLPYNLTFPHFRAPLAHGQQQNGIECE